MGLKKFNDFKLNEAVNVNKASKLKGKVTLYRLTSHHVVDLSRPGEYYVCDKSDVDADLLNKKGKDLYLITVTCDESNIDLDNSDKECAKLDCDCIVSVKDDEKCEIVSVVPYTK